MENIEINTIDTLFKNVSVSSIINSITKVEYKISHDKINKIMFVRIWENHIGIYSKDEIGNIFGVMEEKMEMDGHRSIFNLIAKFNNKVLHENNGCPEVYFEQLLKWQYATRVLGQEIFTTAFFAYNDIFSGRNRTNFLWPQIIKTDNYRLKKLFEKGLAENHYHLKGSSQVFQFSWISLMNNISRRQSQFKTFDADINPLIREYSIGESEKVLSYYHIVKIAYAIRVYLFYTTLGNNKKLNLDSSNHINRELVFKILKTNEDEVDINIGKIEFYAKSMNSILNLGVPDYAVTKDIIDIHPENVVKNFFSGERCFMYNMLKGIFEKKITGENADLFYLYNVIKTKFRTEIIQSNSNIGFRNFADYQDRKSIFISGNKVLNKLFYQAAVLTPVNEQRNLTHFETRIAPEKSCADLYRTISQIDTLIYGEDKDEIDEFILRTGKKQQKGRNATEKRNFYTMHFIKLTEKSFGKSDYDQKKLREDYIVGFIYPRSFELRNRIKIETNALMKFREKSLLNNRIKGIDACNHEIGCRPEIFAQAFRVLRNHNVNNHISSNWINQQQNRNMVCNKLGVTFHVGEDFLDILDGIRAVDEAICFFNMRSGDRLGHALAIGLDVNRWYKGKDYCVTLPRQDLIDNLAWLYEKIHKFDINCETSVLRKIKVDFESVYKEIYTSRCDIGTYYKSMLLRGDDPFYYREEENKFPLSFWDRNRLNLPENCYERELIESCRQDPKIKLLYIDYHFNQKAKSIGSRNIPYKFEKNIVKYIDLVQYKIQQEIAKKGIAIETNPTSNYLISTIKRYENHPITKFNNLGLEKNFENMDKCPQISVSINTDDQGVFDTYLENEYALVALALEKAKDENGNAKYNTTMIYNWLDSVRDMGIKQSFM